MDATLISFILLLAARFTLLSQGSRVSGDEG